MTRRVTGRVLPFLVGLPLAARLLDAPPTSLASLASFVAHAWIVVLVRPLVVAVGFGVVLHAMWTRVGMQAAASNRRAASAVAVVACVQLVGSLVVQAAGPAIGVPLDLAAGAAAALAAYVGRGGPPLGSRAGT